MGKLQLLGQRLAGWYTSLAIILLNIIVILVGLDCAAWVASKAHAAHVPGPAHADADPRARSPFYQSQPWAAAYWREFELSRPMRYQPFVLHRRAPFTGETIHIDQEGIRVTPGADCGPQALKVFTFGGSTMWGTGAPDWGTIPSYLLREMKKRKNGPLCVVNFGESAYVSTQSVIELLLQLQAGHIPDVALFLDGVNDIYAAYQSGRAGLHQNFAQVAARFEGRGGASQKLLEFSHLYVLAKRLATTLHQARSSTPSLLTYETMGVDADSLSQAIIQTYLGNYQMVEGLAQQYGFRAFFFWPPHILIGAKPLTPEEGELKRSIEPAQATLYRSVYRQIEPLVPAYKHLTYLGTIFDHCDFLLWLDDVHFTPVGNELIARKMVEVLTD